MIPRRSSLRPLMASGTARSGGRRGGSLPQPEPGGPARLLGAFTLLEVLLAVVVFAILLLAIHGVFYGALRLRNKTTDSLAQGLPIQQTLQILKRDLANMVTPGGTLFGQLQSAPTSAGTPATTSLPGQSQTSQSSQGFSAFMSASLKGMIVGPSFCTAAGIVDDTAPWGEVERVLYYLAAPTNLTVGKDLIRSVTRNQLPTLQEESVDQWLMSGVQDVVFTYYEGNQWLEIWDSTTQSNKLPQAIKVEIQLAAEETESQTREPITLVVPLVQQPGTNQVAQNTGGGQ